MRHGTPFERHLSRPLKFAGVALAFTLAQPVFSAPEQPATILASGSTLTLSDGRAFTDWKIKRQSAASVFVISANKITTVDKRQLPENLRGQFPYDPAAVAKEAEDLAKADAIGKAHGAEIQAKMDVKRKADYDRRVALAAPEQKREKDLLGARAIAVDELGFDKSKPLDLGQQSQLDMMQESFAHGPDGLEMSQMQVNPHVILVGLHNFTKIARTFDWKKTRAKLWDKSVVEPQSVALTTKADDPDWLTIAPGKTRYYTIEFGGTLPSKLRMFSLANENWLTAVGASAR